MNAVYATSRRQALYELQRDLVEQLEHRGASAVVIHYVLTDLLAHSITYAQIAQRVRRAKERDARAVYQRSQKPLLLSRCIYAFEARCAYCDGVGTTDTGPDGKAWELDRIHPGALGGEYDPLNVALACHACNTKKAANLTWNPPPSLAKLEAA